MCQLADVPVYPRTLVSEIETTCYPRLHWENVHGDADVNDRRGRPERALPAEVPEDAATNMSLVSRSVLGTRVDATSYEDASRRVRDGRPMFALQLRT